MKEWVNKRYQKIKNAGKRSGPDIFWLEEAGVRSDYHLQKTWVLIVKTPVAKTSSKRQSTNIITAVGNNGCFWHMAYSGRFNADKFIEFLRYFMKYQRRSVVLIMDGHPVHKSKKVKRCVDSLGGRLTIELLPPYAPEHNPDE